jgi:predicted Rossmann fold nucleotide-binding protein DprA/Smf involved in DNA uptake
MNGSLSPNTQAILLLTAPLIVGRKSEAPDLLTPGEYKRIARHLLEAQRQPADLLGPDADDVLGSCRPLLDTDRARRLLDRGFLLSQALERWNQRAIWVVSRADSGYPRRLKARLRDDSPPVLYGCGDPAILDTGGLAVVGSRNVDEALLDYTEGVGELTARAAKTLVSGGAKGVDQAAMRGALAAGGQATGVLADRLERTAMNRDHRNLLLDDRLVLVSPYDPGAGFNVGHAMQRNKLIYALADAALIVNADVGKGGTRAGAVEQLEKLRFVPVYVRSTGAPSQGLDALRAQGARPWPNPEDEDGMAAVLQEGRDSKPPPTRQVGLPLEASEPYGENAGRIDEPVIAEAVQEPAMERRESMATPTGHCTEMQANPAEVLFATVRELLLALLAKPHSEAEVSEVLQVSKVQAREWLSRMADEGVLKKLKKPVRYQVRGRDLFGSA